MYKKGEDMYIIMKKIYLVCLALTFSLTTGLMAEDKANITIIKNANIFDGKSDTLIKGKDVLVKNNLIHEVGVALKAEGAKIIDAKGKTLMPGLHDMHTHMTIFREISHTRNSISPLAHGAIAAKRAEGMLLNGYTTVMDVGGAAAYLKPLIEQGIVNGPRIHSAEALISQTSGHGDFRSLNDEHPNKQGSSQHWYERYNSCIADSPAEVTRCARENFRNGASLLKLTVSGGVSSSFDPLHSLQFNLDEVQAAVKAAKNWKTFVATHAYTEESIILSLEAGVKYILHAPLVSKKSAEAIAKQGAYVNVNLQAVLGLSDEMGKKMLSPASYKKWKTLVDAYPIAMQNLVDAKVKFIYGVDLLAPWDQTIAYDKTASLDMLQMVKFLPNVEVLKSATSSAGELVQETGPNNPFSAGPTGVIKAGAYADILLVDGNPLEDISVLTKPDTHIQFIMKDGVIYKNTL